MRPDEALDAFLHHYNILYLNRDAVFNSLFTCIHSNIEVFGESNITGGRIWFTFREAGFAVIAAYGYDEPVRDESVLDGLEGFNAIFAPTHFPGSIELIPGWYGAGVTMRQDATTALYMYYQLCLGVDNPVEDKGFLNKALLLKEG